MEIRCKKGDCTYNTGCSCAAKHVDIDKNTAECKTYNCDPVKHNIVIENGNIFDVADQMVAKNTNNVPLDCDATSCLYNNDKKCVANGITVTDDIKDQDTACCVTYIKK